MVVLLYLEQTLITVPGFHYQYWKYASGTATSNFIGGTGMVERRQRYYETGVNMYKALGIYDSCKDDIDLIEAQQIYANARWCLASNISLSRSDKLNHYRELVEGYCYGYLISKYPFDKVGW